MRIVVADCSIDYVGRLSAHLPRACRMILVKADGTILVHADSGAKALNWMQPPCVLEETDDRWIVWGAKGERLEITVHTVHEDRCFEIGPEPGLRKSGTEDELQAILAGVPQVLEPGLRLVGREYPTDLGPVDLLCEDAAGHTVAVEVKRVGDIDGVEQLCRYIERLEQRSGDGRVRGLFVAQTIRPQAVTFARSRGIECRELDFEALAGRRAPDLTLF